MAKRIMLTPEELRARAKTIRSYKEQDSAVLNKMTNLVSSLCAVWRGSAQDAFVNNFIKGREDFVRFHQTLDHFAGRQETTAKRLEETDNNLRGSIERL